MPVIRRTIDEVATRLRLEPRLPDVFVEGDTDRSFYSWLLASLGRSGVSLTKIEFVEVPVNVLTPVERLMGNRGRVLGLARELALRIPTGSSSYACVVDRDLGQVIPEPAIADPHLVVTDYASVELYAFDEPALAKYVGLFLNVPDVSINDLHRSLVAVLQEAFLARAADRALELQCGAEPLTVHCRLPDRSSISLERESYLTAWLARACRQCSLAEFDATIETLRHQLDPDPRMQIHGHDLLEMLAWWARAVISGSALRNVDILRRGLLPTVDLAAVSTLPSVQQLLALIP